MSFIITGVYVPSTRTLACYVRANGRVIVYDNPQTINNNDRLLIAEDVSAKDEAALRTALTAPSLDARSAAEALVTHGGLPTDEARRLADQIVKAIEERR